MLFNILLFLLMLDGLVLSVAVLLQAGQGGGLASLGGDSYTQVMGGRRATNLATKTTWVTGAAFMVIALILSTMSSSRFGASTSEVQKNLMQNAPAQQTPAGTLGQPVTNILNSGKTETPPAGEGTTTPPKGNQ